MAAGGSDGRFPTLSSRFVSRRRGKLRERIRANLRSQAVASDMLPAALATGLLSLALLLPGPAGRPAVYSTPRVAVARVVAPSDAFGDFGV